MEKASGCYLEQILIPLIKSFANNSLRNAFCINGIFYTYQDLEERTSHIRRILKTIEKENIYFGLIANDDLDTYASIFALWMEGRAYIPINPTQPKERSAEILNQVNAKFILNSNEEPFFKDFNHVYTQNSVSSIGEEEMEIPKIEEDRDAYILFTSGSTGVPKGVRISRRNLAAFVDSFENCELEITRDDKCLQGFDLSFDVSIHAYLIPLLHGACVYTVPHDQIKYSYIYGLLEDEGITVGVMAPSMLRYMRPYFDEIRIPVMKYCILVGEASPLDLIEEWQYCVPNAEIFDFYGPTETTIYCTYSKFFRNSKNKSLNGMLSIGKPMKNVEAIIIGEDGAILNVNEQGELCIYGDQVTKGYWNLPEKNKTSFFEKEINGILKKYYRTGDLCYWDEDGWIMLYGRIDSQVKIQGYRVELGEIEFHAREYLQGANAVVVTSENDIGNSVLILFAEVKEIDMKKLLDYLEQRLPFYMVPYKILCESEFPLNINGKVDRKKLKEKVKEI